MPVMLNPEYKLHFYLSSAIFKVVRWCENIYGSKYTEELGTCENNLSVPVKQSQGEDIFKPGLTAEG